jgi:hypothetical protein
MAANNDRIDQLLDSMAGLYQRDPAAFEACRQELLQTAIASYPNHWQSRARGLQFVIDAKLDLCHDPVSRLNCMIELFWDGVLQFQQILQHPEQALGSRQLRRPAKVLQLRPSGPPH